MSCKSCIPGPKVMEIEWVDEVGNVTPEMMGAIQDALIYGKGRVHFCNTQTPNFFARWLAYESYGWFQEGGGI